MIETTKAMTLLAAQAVLAMTNERDDMLAYVRNAQNAADELRSVIHDGLTGNSDLWLKAQMLDTLDAVDRNLAKAVLG